MVIPESTVNSLQGLELGPQQPVIDQAHIQLEQLFKSLFSKIIFDILVWCAKTACSVAMH